MVVPPGRKLKFEPTTASDAIPRWKVPGRISVENLAQPLNEREGCPQGEDPDPDGIHSGATQRR